MINNSDLAELGMFIQNLKEEFAEKHPEEYKEIQQYEREERTAKNKRSIFEKTMLYDILMGQSHHDDGGKENN